MDGKRIFRDPGPACSDVSFEPWENADEFCTEFICIRLLTAESCFWPEADLNRYILHTWDRQARHSRINTHLGPNRNQPHILLHHCTVFLIRPCSTTFSCQYSCQLSFLCPLYKNPFFPFSLQKRVSYKMPWVEQGKI